MARAFTEALPRALSLAAPASPDALVAVLLRELPADLAKLLTAYPVEAEAALLPGHCDATHALLAELRGTALFGVVRGALAAGEDGASTAECVGSTDLATMLLLVCPDAVFAGVPAGVRTATEGLRALEALPPRYGPRCADCVRRSRRSRTHAVVRGK